MFFRLLLVFLVLPISVFAAQCGGTAPCENAIFNQNTGCNNSAFGRNQNCNNKVFKSNCGCGPTFKRNEGCDKCEEVKKPVEPRTKVYVKNYNPLGTAAYQYIHRECKDFAPISFEYVDFRIKKDNKYEDYSNKLGKYRFRIFGCRREAKEAYLNVGRTMQKDMPFFETFDEVYGECIPQVKMPLDLCDENADTPMPEYILTAEITDYFMNVCDEFDWGLSKSKQERKGSSEMSVTWRLMDVAKKNVYWKGQSTGYAELEYGENDGEILLVDRAFEDALSQLRDLEGFEQQLATRQTPEQMKENRTLLAELEKAINPAKCGYQEEIIQMAKVEEKCPTCPECPAVAEAKAEPELLVEKPQIDEASGLASSASGVSDEGDLKEKVAEIDEASGLDAFGNVDNVRVVETDWIDIAPKEGKIAEAMGIDSKSSFCIENQLTHKKMDPYNVYKTRASIVDIQGSNGKKGVGLIINDQFILTSADLIDKGDNNFKVKTINGVEFKASGFRFSPNKNVALLLAEEKIEYTPLALNLELPPVGSTGFMTLGLNIEEGGEGYVDDSTEISGYRFSEAKGAEIITNKYTQNQTVGGALVDKKGNIYGIAHYGKTLNNDADMYMPIETALKSMSVELCGRQFLNQEPWKKSSIEDVKDQTPEEMDKKKRK